MPAKRTLKQRSQRKATPAAIAWLDYMHSGTLKNITLVAAAGAGIAWLFGNVVQPVYDSGPLPVPSRAELDKLRTETTSTLDGLNKSVANTLEVAKAARMEAQQAVQSSNDARVARLTQQKLQLEATLRMMPGDPVFTDLLARTIQELAKISGAPIAVPQQVGQPSTDTK